MTGHVKNALKKLPWLRRLVAQRDDLLAERDRLLADLVALRRSRDEIDSELVASRLRWQDLASMLSDFEQKLADMRSEISALEGEVQSELAAAEASRDEAQSRKEVLTKELASLQGRWDALHAELVALQDNCDASRAELMAATRDRDRLQRELRALKRNLPGAPPGHFYSPVPSIDEVRPLEDKIFGNILREIDGVDMHEAEQLALLHDFVRYYREMPFRHEAHGGLRYRFDNPAYSYSDGILLHCMIRHLKPRRIVEIGSGFSSCMILDTNDLYFGGAIATTFIEPFPDLLLSLVKDTDKAGLRTIESRLQDVDLDEFRALQANDILFVDSTHVSKIGSDVNRIFFDILPALQPGVHVHFHDIFFPFEYPKTWIYEGRAWNEAYLLRVFLQYNRAFRLVLMNTFMQRFNPSFFQQHMPLCLENTGASVWIRKD